MARTGRCSTETQRATPVTLWTMAESRAAALEAFLAEFRRTGAHADFARVLRSAVFVDNIGRALVEPFEHDEVSGIVAVEARGFVLGALAAHALGVVSSLRASPTRSTRALSRRLPKILTGEVAA